MIDINLMTTGLTLAGFIIANYGIKFGRALPLLKQAFKLMEVREEAKKNGILTQEEKALIYDDIVDLLKEAKAYIKGFFPNKSKE